jgi:hypothetical protein
MLRCNYIMRGVQVPAGEHQVEFRFTTPLGALYVSAAAILFGVALAGYLLWASREEDSSESTPAKS